MNAIRQRLRNRLVFLYGAERADEILERLMAALPSTTGSNSHRVPPTEKDVMLITYGDMVSREGEHRLNTLHDLLNRTVRGTINTVHILPFYPYSSDDGFSVIDYYAVNPDVGTWDDVRNLHGDYRLMFDAVFNHISSQSAWYQAFLRGEAPYTGYFVTADPTEPRLALVRRPRTLPLLTEADTPSGRVHVWTTFSADQIDLNAENPDVLVDLVKVLLFYVEQGADWIRMDAIAYLWKELGTSSIHLSQTHEVVKVFRDMLDLTAPQVGIITETNVPHDENVSYFGDGDDEAQMVYNFSLPPLTLHTFRTGDTTALTRWAASLTRPSEGVSFFNFLASHDGIGVTPARGLISDDDINALLELAVAHGGYVAYKNNSDGSQSPYELNINYFDAITDPAVTAVDPQTAIRRFVAAQSIMLAFMGVPGIYFHSLFGSRNWRAGSEAPGGQKRTINRQKLDADALLAELESDPIRREVFTTLRRLLDIRTNEPAFHPLGNQTVLDVNPGVFALERVSPDGESKVITLNNVRSEAVSVSLPAVSGTWRDLVSGNSYDAGAVTLESYQVAWLKQG